MQAYWIDGTVMGDENWMVFDHTKFNFENDWICMVAYRGKNWKVRQCNYKNDFVLCQYKI